MTQTDSLRSNVPEMSVSQLAFSLKKTLEDSYGHIRVKGELSGLKLAASGHLYGDIKDEDANVNIICWRGTMSKLAVKPEEGLEVVITGKVSSYPKSSRYQIIVESMELAGEGALLKMLEERRRKLAAEGLFDPERKKALPFLPDVIGVVTSPTGAVIKDIMHRLADRFPRHVLLYPVAVQGDGAAEQIARAINAFHSMPARGDIPRPDVLIVARGGGSLEDLMAFNEEIVVRAVAACSIPVISAVGHETDTTLIDYAADVRAPTPTGAAEMAVPVRTNLMAQILEDEKRLLNAVMRLLEERRSKLATQAAYLGDPQKLLELKAQNIDHVAHKLLSGFEKTVSAKKADLIELRAKLRTPDSLIKDRYREWDYAGKQLVAAGARLFKEKQQKYNNLSEKLEILSFKNVLDRGFVVVRDENGKPVTAAHQTRSGQLVQLEFKNNDTVQATIAQGEGPGTVKAAAGKGEKAKNKPGEATSHKVKAHGDTHDNSHDNAHDKTQNKTRDNAKAADKQGDLF